MTRILFKFIINPFCEWAVKNGSVKSKIFGKSSFNFIFDQGSCLILDLAGPNSDKAVLVQISPRFEIIIFNNNFAFFVAGFLEPVMSSFSSMP